MNASQETSAEYSVTMNQQMFNEINLINLRALKRIDNSVREILNTCKVSKLMEFSDVWHTKDKGPCFIVVKIVKNQRRHAVIKLNQEKFNEDYIVDITKDIDFGFNDEQQMIYWKRQDEVAYGLWIAIASEYKDFRTKLQAIAQEVKK